MAKFSRAFAQFEREMMLERQREGIAKAKAENRYLGSSLKNDEAVKLFREGRTVRQIAAALTIGRRSVYRALEAAGMRQGCGRDEVASSRKTRASDRRPLRIAFIRGRKRASSIKTLMERSSSSASQPQSRLSSVVLAARRQRRRPR